MDFAESRIDIAALEKDYAEVSMPTILDDEDEDHEL